MGFSIHKKKKELSIVAVGTVNPTIFSPSWLKAEGLVEPNADSRVVVIHPEICKFFVEDTEFEVTPQRLILRTGNETEFEKVRDFFISFSDLIRHTPLRTFGINLDMTWFFSDEKEWDAFGDFLSPHKNWKNILKDPKLAQLGIRGANPWDEDGYILFKLTPVSIPNFKHCLKIEINNHFTIQKQENEIYRFSEIANILTPKTWNELLKSSEEKICTLLKSTKGDLKDA